MDKVKKNELTNANIKTLPVTLDPILSDYIWGYSVKWFIVIVWGIPWAIILGYTLSFSSLFWGIMQYYLVVMLVFIITDKDYAFLPLTYLCTGIYFLYSLPQRWISSTYLGFYKTIIWGVINITFALLIIFNRHLRAYKKIHHNVKKENLPNDILSIVIKRISFCTIIMGSICLILLGVAYEKSKPINPQKNYNVEFTNKSFEKAIRTELNIEDDSIIKRSDLDQITNICINNSTDILLGQNYSFSTSEWLENDVFLNFSDLFTCEGNPYTLETPLTTIKDLQHFRKLKYLKLNSDSSLIIYNLDDIRGCTKLETLVTNSSKFKKSNETNFNAIQYLSSLKCLVMDALKIDNIDYLKNLSKLEVLKISNSATICNLSVLVKLKNLEYLSLSGCNIENIKPITKLSKLKYLSLTKNIITDISPIVVLDNLSYLDLRSNQISDILPLGSLVNIKYIALLENGEITDISSLVNLINLKYLWIENKDSYDLSTLNTNTELEIYTGQ